MLPVVLIAQDAAQWHAHINSILKSAGVFDVSYFGVETPLDIDEIRKISISVLRPTFKMTAYVLVGFDRLKREAQNAFLKTLEEHNQSTFFILIASREHDVLSTILSRCKVERLAPNDEEDTPVLMDLGLFDNSISVASLLVATQSLKKDSHLAAITQIRSQLYKKAHTSQISLGSMQTLYQALDEIIDIEYKLKNNIYPEFALDYILIMLLKKKILPFAQS